MAHSVRNPPWTRDELIIALDLYLRHRDRLPSPHDPQIVEASRVLNALSSAIRAQFKSFRNANAVYMKLNNFRGIDPAYTSQGKRGLTRGGLGDREIWAEFADRRADIAELAAAIRLALSDAKVETEPLPEGMTEASEGRLLTQLHVRRERSSKLVAMKKQQVLRTRGTLACEACGFNFETTYGEHGMGFIEAHHLQPIHTLRPGSRTRLADLALLCANCHRMIHARKPWITLDQLRVILRQQQK